jgi:UDP-glucose 4-epimerase
VVVAGAGGYVGGRLVEELVERPGVDVVAIARKPRPWLEHVEQRSVDLRERVPGLADALAGADAVVHLAGPSEVLAAAEPERVLADTVAISSNLGSAARDAGCGRFVYLSTTHVYGTRVTPGAVLTEDMRPEPRHPYAIARLASEHALAGLGIDPVCLRLTNSVGAPVHAEVDRWTLVVNDLCRQAVSTGELRLNTDGTQWRDFVSLADAARIIADLALGAGRPGVWNLGSGTAWRVRDVAGLVADTYERLTGERPPVVAPDPTSDPEAPPTVDVSGLAGDGLSSTTPLEAAVEEIAEFCLEHRDALQGAERR